MPHSVKLGLIMIAESRVFLGCRVQEDRVPGVQKRGVQLTFVDSC